MSEPDSGAAGMQAMQDAITQLGTMIHAQLPRIHRLELAVQQLTTSVQALQATATSAVPSGSQVDATSSPALPATLAVPPLVTTPLVAPQPFSGEPSACKGFILQCNQVFQHQTRLFPTEEVKVGYIISRLKGPALDWACAVFDRQLPECSNSTTFLERLSCMFDTEQTEDQAAQRILAITQGARTVAQYAVEFRTLAVRSGWQDHALRSAFYRGLRDSVKDELVNRDQGATLDDLVTLAIRLDARLQERRRERRDVRLPSISSSQRASAPSPTVNQPEPQVEEAMELGRFRLTPAERSRRLQRGLCLYCGSAGHQRQSCPDLQGKDSAHQGAQGH